MHITTVYLNHPPSLPASWIIIKIVGKGGTGLLQQGAGARAHAQRRNGGARAAEAEAQGATSWSSDDLRVKYRAEREREEAYQAFRLEEQVAEALEKDYGQASAS